MNEDRKTIKEKHLCLALGCVLMASLSVFIGFFRYGAFAAAVLFLLSCIYVDKKYLRCPRCGGFINLDRLLLAGRKPHFCSFCGGRITIEKK